MPTPPKLLCAALAMCIASGSSATTPHALAFAKLIDNSNGLEDSAKDLAVDALGNIYLLTHTLVSNQNWMFVSKIDPVGNQLWKQGTYPVQGGMGLSLDVDSSGNIAVGSVATSGTYTTVAPVYFFDAFGNARFTPLFADSQGGTMRAFGVKYDSSGNLHTLIENLNSNVAMNMCLITGTGTVGTSVKVAPMQFSSFAAGSDGRMLIHGFNSTGGAIVCVDPSNGIVLSQQYNDTFNNQTHTGTFFRTLGGFDAAGNFQFAINANQVTNTAPILTYTYRSYDAAGNLLWHFDNISGGVGSIQPVGPNEGYYISVDQLTHLHHVTNLGDTWSVQVLNASRVLLDDTGGCFVEAPINNGSQNGISVTKYDSSGTVQWNDVYYPATGSLNYVTGKVRNGILYLIGDCSTFVNGTPLDVMLLKYVQGIALAHMGLSSNSATGPTKVTGTVQLNAPAPPGGYLAYLTSTNPAAVGVPPQIIVPAGASSASFTCTVDAVDAAQWVTISAQSHGAVGSTALLVNPAKLNSLSFSPTSIKVGAFSTGTLSLTGITGGSGRLVQLSSSNPSAVQVLPTTYIGPGVSTGSFSAKAVGGVGTTVTITATLDGVQKTATVTVSP